MSDHAGINGDRKVFNIVGKSNLPGSLSCPIATGKARFGSDVVISNMLRVEFLRSPIRQCYVWLFRHQSRNGKHAAGRVRGGQCSWQMDSSAGYAG